MKAETGMKFDYLGGIHTIGAMHDTVVYVKDAEGYVSEIERATFDDHIYTGVYRLIE